MMPLPQGDRALRAVPSRTSSPLARFGAWARESLVARAAAAAVTLAALAAIGNSSFARSAGGASNAADASAAPAAIASVAPAPAESPRAAPAATVDFELPAAEEPPRALANAAPSARPPRATPDDPVDLNAATTEDLRRLPGVGQKRAEAILALRSRLPGARFRQIEDLLKVKGIGRAMLKRLSPVVRLGGGAASPPRSASS
ncbi:MAG TPA: helix-hairpin-helix domain-containing protein [Polyangiaceae bacterium]|jgi:competence protein ComEA